jgi:hypothetical protein
MQKNLPRYMAKITLICIVYSCILVEIAAYAFPPFKLPPQPKRRLQISGADRGTAIKMQLFPFQNVKFPKFFNDDTGDATYHESRIRCRTLFSMEQKILFPDI